MSQEPRRPLFSLGKRQGDQPPLVRIDARSLAYFAVILILMGLAGWLYLHQAAQVATYAHDIRRIESDKERTHREMIALKARVAEAGSLERVLARASDAGYSIPRTSDKGRMLILEVPIVEDAPLAEHEGAPTEPEPKTEAAPVGQGLIDELRRWLQAAPDR